MTNRSNAIAGAAAAPADGCCKPTVASEAFAPSTNRWPPTEQLAIDLKFANTRSGAAPTEWLNVVVLLPTRDFNVCLSHKVPSNPILHTSKKKKPKDSRLEKCEQQTPLAD